MKEPFTYVLCAFKLRLISDLFQKHCIHYKALDKATGEHFNRPGHKCADMGVTILEKVYNKDPMFLTVREEFWIRQFNSKYKGMNRNKGG